MSELEPFSQVKDWIFDLDNTLYPRHCDLFGQIDKRMTAYVSRLTGLEHDPARRLQKDLYRSHGTTLRGLMHEYEIDPHDFLYDVHDIDYSELEENPELGGLISSLPGRKFIFTNGDVRHAENTLDAIGITDIFDGIFDIVKAEFVPKPAEEPYQLFLKEHGINTDAAAMFEDMPRNLKVPKAMGMRTVLITPKKTGTFKAEHWEHDESDADYIDHATNDLNVFLDGVISQLSN